MSDQIYDLSEVSWCLLGGALGDTEDEAEVIKHGLGSAVLLHFADMLPNIDTFFGVGIVVREGLHHIEG